MYIFIIFGIFVRGRNLFFHSQNVPNYVTLNNFLASYNYIWLDSAKGSGPKIFYYIILHYNYNVTEVLYRHFSNSLIIHNKREHGKSLS